MTRVLVTGATSYLAGKTIPRLLAAGHDVIAVIRPESDATAVARLTVPTCRWDRLAPADTLIHLATLYSGQTLPGQATAIAEANVTAPIELVARFVDAGGRRVIAAGTAWEDCGPARQPANLYAASKAAFRTLGSTLCEERERDWLWLRFSDLVGRDDPRHRLFHAIGESLRSGVPLSMTAGDQPFDPLAIDDGAAALVAATALPAARPLSLDVGLAGQSPGSLRDKVQSIFDRYGRSALPQWGDRSYRRGEPFRINWQPPPPWWRPRLTYDTIVEQVFGP